MSNGSLLHRSIARSLSSALLGLVMNLSPAQDLLMSGGAFWNACEGRFVDSGGADGAYGNDQDQTATLCPGGGAGSGASTAITFTSFAVGGFLDADQLVIHDGSNTSAPVLATGNANNTLTGQTFIASGASGCLTFHFTSNFFANAAGWTADIITGPDAGVDNSLTLCSGQSAFLLFEALGGDPDVGGAWVGPTGPHGPLYDPGIDPGGIYTYVVVDGSGCSDSSTVTITSLPSPDAGDDGNLLICAASGPIDLFAALSGAPDPGGTWTGPDGPHGSFFDPANDPPGAYTYALPSAPPCPDASATLVVSLTGAPDAGSNGQLVACDTITALDLIIGLGGTPQPGGAWVDLDNTGALLGGVLNTTALPEGSYDFQYVVDVLGCGSDQALLTVQVIDALELIDLERDCSEYFGTSVIRFTLTQGNAPTYTVTGISGTVDGDPPFSFTSDELPDSVSYTITVNDPNGCGPLTFVVPRCSYPPRVIIPELFTPNGDGINERFSIPGIEDFPRHELRIYDRWGGLVHHGNAVDIDPWDGTTEHFQEAPSGTYFYVLDLGNGQQARRGAIQLQR